MFKKDLKSFDQSFSLRLIHSNTLVFQDGGEKVQLWRFGVVGGWGGGVSQGSASETGWKNATMHLSLQPLVHFSLLLLLHEPLVTIKLLLM